MKSMCSSWACPALERGGRGRMTRTLMTGLRPSSLRVSALCLRILCNGSVQVCGRGWHSDLLKTWEYLGMVPTGD